MAIHLRSRREVRAQTFISARSRRDAPHRDPNMFEIIVGVTIFVVMSSGCLYILAALGR